MPAGPAGSGARPTAIGHDRRRRVPVKVIASRPVAHHRRTTGTERRRDLVVVPGRQLARRHPPRRGAARRAFRPPIPRPSNRTPAAARVEEIAAGADEHLVERAEQSGVPTGKQETVQARPREETCNIGQLSPRLGHPQRTPGSSFEGRLFCRILEQVASVVQQADVEVPRHLQQPSAYPGQLRGRGKMSCRGSPASSESSGDQPLRLRGRVLRVRGQKVDARSAGLELRPHERIQLGVRQARHDVDPVAGGSLERSGWPRTDGSYMGPPTSAALITLIGSPLLTLSIRRRS